MHRLGLAAALYASACGESLDDRPLELNYLTQAIFAPSCGTTQCHSTFKQAANRVFDTPEATRRSLVDNQLILFDSGVRYDPDSPAEAPLIVWMTEIDPFERGIGRMPYDAPLPNKDIYLLQEWIAAEAPGAQCNPEASGGRACRNRTVVECNDDWSFGNPVMTCPNNCVQGACL